MKIFHTLTLIAALSIGTAAFAKTASSTTAASLKITKAPDETMDDQDYSAWKDYFYGFKRGNALSMFSKAEKPALTGMYDEQVFKYLKRVFFSWESMPDRHFDNAGEMMNDDVKWKWYEMAANAYRREIMKENEMQMKMMGKSWK